MSTTGNQRGQDAGMSGNKRCAEIDISKYIYSGKGKVLLPWKAQISERGISGFSDRWIAAHPVVCSFANTEGRAWPSIRTIAVLGGISKTTAINAVHSLEEKNWIAVTKIPIQHGRVRFEYRVDRYSFGERGKWISIGTTILRNGLWAMLPASARRLYVVLKSYAFPGAYGLYGRELLVGNDDDAWHGDTMQECDFDFVPMTALSRIDREQGGLSALCRFQQRTLSYARGVLREYGLIEAADPDFALDGIVLPLNVDKIFPDILARLGEADKDEKPSRAATAFVRSVRRRQHVLGSGNTPKAGGGLNPEERQFLEQAKREMDEAFRRYQQSAAANCEPANWQ